MNIDQKIYRYMYVCLVKKHVHVITVNEKEFQKVFNMGMMGKANSEADQEKRGWWGGGGENGIPPPPTPFNF